MKDPRLLFAMIAVLLTTQDAVFADSSMTIDFDPRLIEEDSATGNQFVRLCFYANDQSRSSRSECDHEGSFPTGDGSVALKTICNDILTYSSKASKEWYISSKQKPRQLLYDVLCESLNSFGVIRNLSEKKPQPSGKGSGGRSHKAPPPATVVTTPQTTGPAVSNTMGQDILRELEVLKSQLKDIESRILTTSTTTTRQLADFTNANKNLDQRILDLESGFRKDVDMLMSAVTKSGSGSQRAAPPPERSQRTNCQRLDLDYEGQEEVVVRVHETALRFVKISVPNNEVVIGLDHETAQKFYQEAAEKTPAIKPSILRSVPAETRKVPPFFIQERLIDPKLYSDLLSQAGITGDVDARRVSFQDVQQFINQLNQLCAGEARFDLPSEEQFVAAAKKLYDPAKKGALVDCSGTRWSTYLSAERKHYLPRLFGQFWQLTNSPCLPFSEDAEVKCEDGTYVRKGGSHKSRHALECMPEFRGEVSEDVAQVNTTFRLVLR